MASHDSTAFSTKGFVRKLYLSAMQEETTFDTYRPVDYMFRVSSDPFTPVVEVTDDLDLIGGVEEISQIDVNSKRMEGTIEIPRVKPLALAAIAYYAMGTDTVTQTSGQNSFRHEISGSTDYSSGMQLKSFSAVEDYGHNAGTQWNGIMVDSFTLSGDRNGYISFSASVIGSSTNSNTDSSLMAAGEGRIVTGKQP